MSGRPGRRDCGPAGLRQRLRGRRPVDPSDGRLANLLFFVLVPETATQVHLDLLAEIARLVSNPTLRQALSTETDPAVIHRLLTSEPAEASTD